jgi:hypothetical protein
MDNSAGRRLVEAVRAGDVVRVADLLSDTTKQHIAGPKSSTNAARRRSLADFSADEGLDEGWTLLSESCRVGGWRGALMVLLLDHAGASMNVVDLSGWTALHWCVAGLNGASSRGTDDAPPNPGTPGELSQLLRSHGAFKRFFVPSEAADSNDDSEGEETSPPLFRPPIAHAVLRALTATSFCCWDARNNNGERAVDTLDFNTAGALSCASFVRDMLPGGGFKRQVVDYLTDVTGRDSLGECAELIEAATDNPEGFMAGDLPRELDQTPALVIALRKLHKPLVRALLRAGASPAGHVDAYERYVNDRKRMGGVDFPDLCCVGIDVLLDAEDYFQTPAHVAASSCVASPELPSLALIRARRKEMLKWLFAAQARAAEYRFAEDKPPTSIFARKDSQGRTPLDVAREHAGESESADSELCELIAMLMEKDPLMEPHVAVKSAAFGR